MEMRFRDGFPSFPFFLSALMPLSGKVRHVWESMWRWDWMSLLGVIFLFAHILHMFLLRTYFGSGFCGSKEDGFGCVYGYTGCGLDGEGAVGVWMGWDGKVEWEMGKGDDGKEECYLGSVCSSLAQSVSLSIDYI